MQHWRTPFKTALVDQREDETEEEPLRSREEEGLPSSSEGVEEEGGGRSPYKPPSMATEVWKLHKIQISGNPKTQNTTPGHGVYTVTMKKSQEDDDDHHHSSFTVALISK